MVHLFAVSATLDVIIQSHEMPSAADRERQSMACEIIEHLRIYDVNSALYSIITQCNSNYSQSITVVYLVSEIFSRQACLQPVRVPGSC